MNQLSRAAALLRVTYGGGSPSRHYNDVTMDSIASQITSLTIVYSAVYSGADQRKHQSSASLAFVRGIHRGPVNSPHKWPVTRKMFPFDDVIMGTQEIIDGFGRVRMTSWHGNVFPIIGPLWGKSTSDKWIPLTWSFGYFLCCCGSNKPVVWDTMTLMWR